MILKINVLNKQSKSSLFLIAYEYLINKIHFSKHICLIQVELFAIVLYYLLRKLLHNVSFHPDATVLARKFSVSFNWCVMIALNGAKKGSASITIKTIKP